MRIVVVTDSHLAADAHAYNSNWSAVREFIGSVNADLTIHLGDITVDGRKDPAQFWHVQAISAATSMRTSALLLQAARLLPKLGTEHRRSAPAPSSIASSP